MTGSEAYTSKQCGKCGFLNDKLGASEIFRCRRCKVGADRVAARNILLLVKRLQLYLAFTLLATALRLRELC
jgi:transposase